MARMEGMDYWERPSRLGMYTLSLIPAKRLRYKLSFKYLMLWRKQTCKILCWITCNIVLARVPLNFYEHKTFLSSQYFDIGTQKITMFVHLSMASACLFDETIFWKFLWKSFFLINHCLGLSVKYEFSNFKYSYRNILNY